MKRNLLLLPLVLIVSAFLVGEVRAAESEWPGIDEAVVKKFAEQAGRPAREPYINIAQGDIQLLAFLLAGCLGGFIAGYYWRDLFPSQTSRLQE